MRYIVSENYLCLFSLIEMILNDIGYGQYSQYDLANEFGVVLPSNYHIEGVIHYDVNDNEFMQGTHTDADTIELFFKKKSIPLSVSYIQSNPYAEYPIQNEDLKENYCIATISYGSLNANAECLNVGHACLILEINGRTAKIYDPGPQGSGIKTVDLPRLYDAMYDIGGGLYMFKKGEKNEQRVGRSKAVS